MSNDDVRAVLVIGLGFWLFSDDPSLFSLLHTKLAAYLQG